ncbi:hypothetical protein C8J56DRAFT_854424 [Mycena floridula]|nr:hypothetical protein C8J56DRAFT_854424 [Mycena floridula]
MPVAKWKSEKFNFSLPSPETKLSEIKEIIAQKWHLDSKKLKLICSGAILKDDNAPISAYNLRNSSTIAVVASEEPLPKATQSTSSKSERTTISLIQAEMEGVRGLSPSVEAFLSSLKEQKDASPALQEKEHTRLGELLLQSLLRLDAISTDSEFQDARKERKVAVNEVQSLLDRLDNAWRQRDK